MNFKDYLKIYLENNIEKVLYIIRGPPGSGKSYLANSLKDNGKIFETDELFINDKGEYKFDPSKISLNHKLNQERAIKAMEEGISPIIISNTATRAIEVIEYVKAAIKNKYKIQIKEPNWNKELKDSTGKWNFDYLKGKNVHGVPDNSLKNMINRYESHDIFMNNLKKLINNRGE